MSMNSFGIRALITLARPSLMAIAGIRRPTRTLDTWLDLRLTTADHATLYTICEEGSAHVGDYYRLYAEKKLIASTLRRCDRPSLLSLARSIDQTDYSQFTATLQGGQGLVIALPHYGHYIVTAINVMEHIRDQRDVYMLYGDPKHHPGNELFDALSRILFVGQHCRARILHADARGLATALRALRTGAILITMPDVCPDEQHAYVIPFLRRQLEIPLGTASLARRSGAALIPAISHCEGPLRIRALFGDHIQVAEHQQSEDQILSQASDYEATLKMFGFFEGVMKRSPLHWQYVITHYGLDSPFPETTPSEVDTTWLALQESNHLLRDHSHAIAIDLHEAQQ